MQSDKFDTEKVISGRNASWDRKVDETFIRDHRINGPRPVRVESIFPDLEPLEASNRRSQSGVDLGKVSHNRAFV